MKHLRNKIFFLSIILPLLLISILSSPLSAEAKMFVVTTTPDLADIARNVGGNKVVVESIAAGNQDPHFVEAKPSFMIKLRKADLYLVSGLELEIGWSPVLEKGAGNPKIMDGADSYIDCSENIPTIEVPTTRIDRSMGDVHPMGNPHYLLDPNNGITVAKTIADAFAKKDPANSSHYNENYKKYRSELVKKQIEWLRAMKPYKGMKVVTYHKTWSYFARRFGLDVVGYVESKPGIAPSPAHIASLIKTMKANNVKILIREPHFEGKIPETICRNTGAKQLVLPIMPGGVSGTDTYTGMFDYIIKNLVNAAK